MSWLVAFQASRALAQSGSLLLISDTDVSSSLERSVKRRLGQVADVLDERAYTAAVKAAGLSPSSDAALTKLGPRSGAALIVHLRVDASGDLQAEVRSGTTGAVCSTLEFPLLAQGRRFKRPSRALRDLAASVHEGLSRAGHPQTQPSTQDSELEDDASASLPGDSRSEPAAAVGSSPQQASTPQVSSSDEQIMDDPELHERLAASSSDSAAGPRQGLGLQASVGLGPGSHTLSVPNTSGRLETGVAPAVELAAAAELGLGHWMFRAAAQYRTFFGSSPAPIPSDSVSGMMPAQSVDAPLTSHSFTVGASPGYRFGGRNSVALQLMLGWTYRSLQASVTSLPGASLSGLVARPALYIPFGDGVFCLRLAPELIFVQSTEASAPIDNGAGGAVTTQTSGGTGFGMEAALDVKLAKLLGAGLQFRRSRVVAWRSSAIDEEWYVSVQAVLSL